MLARGGGRLAAVEDRHGVTVHRVREPEFPKDDLDAFVRWVDAMNDDMRAAGAALGDALSFDLVHSHDWLVAGAARKLARRFGCPWLVTVHATEHGRHQGWVNKHPQRHIHGVERRMVRAADGVITCSHYMRGHVAEVFGIDEERVTVVPNGVDPGDLQPVADLPRLRARYAAPDERLVLLVGRLVYEKGFHLALDALPGVIERLGNVRFLVAGSGTAERELKAQARKLGLDRHGDFLGWIDDAMLHSLYAISDLCVIPSLYEPFGLVALEAMASGCPCIVADTGGLREVVPGRRARRAALPRARLRLAGGDDGEDPQRRRPARPARGRGVGAHPALRLGRRRPPDGGGLRGARRRRSARGVAERLEPGELGRDARSARVTPAVARRKRRPGCAGEAPVGGGGVRRARARCRPAPGRRRGSSRACGGRRGRGRRRPPARRRPSPAPAGVRAAASAARPALRRLSRSARTLLSAAANFLSAPSGKLVSPSTSSVPATRSQSARKAAPPPGGAKHATVATPALVGAAKTVSARPPKPSGSSPSKRSASTLPSRTRSPARGGSWRLARKPGPSRRGPPASAAIPATMPRPSLPVGPIATWSASTSPGIFGASPRRSQPLGKRSPSAPEVVELVSVLLAERLGVVGVSASPGPPIT